MTDIGAFQWRLEAWNAYHLKDVDELLFSYVAEQEGDFLDAAYNVSRLGTKLDSVPTGLRDVRFIVTAPFNEPPRMGLAAIDAHNDRDLETQRRIRMGDLMGLTEIAKLLDKTPEEVWMMHHRGKLPKHDETISGGRTKIWYRETIERWIQEEQT